VSTDYVYNEYFIQADLVEALELYVSDGALPGDFLQAVLRNDLVDACGRADHINIRNLPAFAAWLYNEAPIPSWGSPEKVAAWLERKKLESGRREGAADGGDMNHGVHGCTHDAADLDRRFAELRRERDEARAQLALSLKEGAQLLENADRIAVENARVRAALELTPENVAHYAKALVSADDAYGEDDDARVSDVLATIRARAGLP
jgi:hypothetical protein